MHRILFVCSRNRLRSPTAESMFAAADVETDSAGLAPHADCVLSVGQVEWADTISVMERQHKVKLKQRFAAALQGKKIVCLDVPDRFQFMQPELVNLLQQKVSQHLR